MYYRPKIFLPKSSYSMFGEDIFVKQDGEYKMIIPPEILEQQGWKVGDTLKFDIGDKGTIIITKPDDPDKENPNVVVIESVPEDAKK